MIDLLHECRAKGFQEILHVLLHSLLPDDTNEIATLPHSMACPYK